MSLIDLDAAPLARRAPHRPHRALLLLPAALLTLALAGEKPAAAPVDPGLICSWTTAGTGAGVVVLDPVRGDIVAEFTCS